MEFKTSCHIMAMNIATMREGGYVNNSTTAFQVIDTIIICYFPNAKNEANYYAILTNCDDCMHMVRKQLCFNGHVTCLAKKVAAANYRLNHLNTLCDTCRNHKIFGNIIITTIIN